MVTYSCDYVHQSLDSWFSLTNNSSQTISYNFNNAMYAIGFFDPSQIWVSCSASPDQTLLSSLNTQQQSEILTGVLASGQSCWNKFVYKPNQDDLTLQAGSVPLLTIANSLVNFRFWSGGSGEGQDQHININGTGQFTITEDSDSINVAVGMGVSIVLDGGGGPLKTNNIYITVADCPGAYSLSSWLGNYPNNTYWYSFLGSTVTSNKPPSLTIETLDDSYQIALDGSTINNWTYDATNSQLSWSAEDGNWSAATLTFSFNSDNQATFSGNLQMVAPETPTSGTFSGTVANVVG